MWYGVDVFLIVFGQVFMSSKRRVRPRVDPAIRSFHDTQVENLYKKNFTNRFVLAERGVVLSDFIDLFPLIPQVFQF